MVASQRDDAHSMLNGMSEVLLDSVELCDVININNGEESNGIRDLENDTINNDFDVDAPLSNTATVIEVFRNSVSRVGLESHGNNENSNIDDTVILPDEEKDVIVVVHDDGDDDTSDSNDYTDTNDKNNGGRFVRIAVAVIILGLILFVIIDYSTTGYIRMGINNFLEFIETNPILGIFLFSVGKFSIISI